ncbi:hypothetical protein NTE19_003398 [Vibrio fluvialis]|nr:hypothetical protein [Vibrio fluvialis]
MAKVSRDTGIAITGVSNSAAQKALEAAANMKEGAEIKLPVGDKLCSFELVVIPYLDIEKRTSVLPENARLQKTLNKISLGRTYRSIEEVGQKYPAIGGIDAHGKIEVWDGSCRRKSCILAKEDFRILVTREVVPTKAKKSMSDIGNMRNALSLYERGQEWEQMLKDGEYPDAKQLAIGEEVDESIVTAARKAFSIPQCIIERMPSIQELGRPSINTICKTIKGLDSKTIDEIVASLEHVTLDELIAELGSENGKRLNALFLHKLLEAFPAPAAKKTKKTTDKDDQLEIEVLTIPQSFKRVPVASRGKTNAVMAESGNVALIELENVDNAIMEDIYHFIRLKIEEATS